MDYAVWALKENSFEKLYENTFTRYQDAKRYAKELAAKAEIIEVWIEGYERVLNKDLNF